MDDLPSSQDSQPYDFESGHASRRLRNASSDDDADDSSQADGLQRELQPHEQLQQSTVHYADDNREAILAAIALPEPSASQKVRSNEARRSAPLLRSGRLSSTAAVNSLAAADAIVSPLAASRAAASPSMRSPALLSSASSPNFDGAGGGSSDLSKVAAWRQRILAAKQASTLQSAKAQMQQQQQQQQQQQVSMMQASPTLSASQMPLSELVQSQAVHQPAAADGSQMDMHSPVVPQPFAVHASPMMFAAGASPAAAAVLAPPPAQHPLQQNAAAPTPFPGMESPPISMHVAMHNARQVETPRPMVHVNAAATQLQPLTTSPPQLLQPMSAAASPVGFLTQQSVGGSQMEVARSGRARMSARDKIQQAATAPLTSPSGSGGMGAQAAVSAAPAVTSSAMAASDSRRSHPHHSRDGSSSSKSHKKHKKHRRSRSRSCSGPEDGAGTAASGALPGASERSHSHSHKKHKKQRKDRLRSSSIAGGHAIGAPPAPPQQQPARITVKSEFQQQQQVQQQQQRVLLRTPLPHPYPTPGGSRSNPLQPESEADMWDAPMVPAVMQKGRGKGVVQKASGTYNAQGAIMREVSLKTCIEKQQTPSLTQRFKSDTRGHTASSIFGRLACSF